MGIAFHLLPLKQGVTNRYPQTSDFPVSVSHLSVMSCICLMECSHPSITPLYRENFLEHLFIIDNDFKKFTFKTLLLYILAKCDVNIISLCSHYIDEFSKRYKSLLCDEFVTWLYKHFSSLFVIMVTVKFSTLSVMYC